MKSIPFTILAGAFALVASHAAEIGKPAPDFSVKNTTGETVDLASLKGKVVVLEWVNYQCPFVSKHYSTGNMPKLQETYTGKDVVWLTVSSAAEGKQGYYDAAKMAEVAKEQKNKATHTLMDTDGKMGKAFDAKVTPHMFIINKDGVLVYDGAIDSDPKDPSSADKLFAKALDAVLAGSPVENAKNKPYGCGVKY